MTIQLLQGDCLTLMKDIPSGSVDAVINNNLQINTAYDIIGCKEATNERPTGSEQASECRGSVVMGESQVGNRMALSQPRMDATRDSELLQGIAISVLQGDEAPIHSAEIKSELWQEKRALQGRNGEYALQDNDRQGQVLNLWRNQEIGDSSQERGASRQSPGESTSPLQNMPRQPNKKAMVGKTQSIIVVTDPPYGINVDTSWLTALNMQRGKPSNKSDAQLIGDDKSIDMSWLDKYDKWVVFGFPYLQRPDVTGWLVWDKWPGVTGGGLGNPVEMAMTNCWRGFKMMRVLWAGFYRAIGEKRYEHPTQKPELLMRQVILAISEPGDTILDPFMGSGTTGVACVQTGRSFIGIEIDPGYFAIAERRISAAQLQVRMEI